ncbi:MAG: hypothetical protein Ct9H300mP20_16940 [Gammaproteobacteria bacterium]|nr:MAG: hypothetical protein Ct9H300mP20_16940 [Gammaproteobacteria bacterium]
MLEIAIWLSETKWSIALLESLYMYPWIESAHVLSICFFIGILLFVDLRLMGVAFTKLPISEMNKKVLPWSLFGFGLMMLTGFLLFYAIPVRSYQNIFFRFKVILILLAGLNAFLFHRQMKLEGMIWDEGKSIPKSVHLKAAASLVLWSGVIISGRMIAYNWFDCDRQPQPEWVNWAAGCIVDLNQMGGLDGI